MITKRLMRLPEVISVVGISKAQIYKLIARGEFPKQRQLTERTSAWRSDEIDQWIESRQTRIEALKAIQAEIRSNSTVPDL